jgi:hypothetical protein
MKPEERAVLVGLGAAALVFAVIFAIAHPSAQLKRPAAT